MPSRSMLVRRLEVGWVEDGDYSKGGVWNYSGQQSVSQLSVG